MIKPEWHWMYFNDESNGKEKTNIETGSLDSTGDLGCDET